MIILTLVDGYEEIFETFHLLKSCRSTTRYHSVLDINRVHSPHPLLLRNCCLLLERRERERKGRGSSMIILTLVDGGRERESKTSMHQ